MAKGLANFSVTGAGDDYLLSFEDEDGETIELTATAEQLDLISETIAEHMEMEDLADFDEDEAED